MVQVGPGVGGAVAQLAPLLVGGPVTQLVRHLESIFGGLVVVLSSEIIKKMLYCCLKKHYPLSQNTTINLNNYHTWKYFLIKKITMTLLCAVLPSTVLYVPAAVIHKYDRLISHT